MSTFLSTPLAYGQSQPLIQVLPMPVASESIPGVNTRGVLGQINIVANTAYMLIGIINGAAQWVALGGADGNFNALVVTTTIQAGGNISTNADVIVGVDLSVGGNAQIDGTLNSTGNITTDGSVIATMDITARESLYVAGDGGAAIAGVLGLTNVVDDTQGAGALTLVSTTGAAGTNTGFIKAYIGADVIWLPYFVDIAP